MRKKSLLYMLVGVFSLAALALFGVLGYFYYQDMQLAPEKVFATNVTDSGATYTWYTSDDTIGKVKVKEVGGSWLGETFYDDRDVEQDMETGEYVLKEAGAQKRNTHHVSIRGLEPEKEYEVVVAGRITNVDKDKSGAELVNITTPEVNENLTTPDPAYGMIEGLEDNDAIILVKLVDGASVLEENVISTVVSDTYSYSFDINGLLGDINSESLGNYKMHVSIMNDRALSHGFDYGFENYKPITLFNFDNSQNESSGENGSLSSSLIGQVEAIDYPCHASCSNGSTFDDPGPQTFGSCSSWCSAACGTVSASVSSCSGESSSSSSSSDVQQEDQTQPPSGGGSCGEGYLDFSGVGCIEASRCTNSGAGAACGASYTAQSNGSSCWCEYGTSSSTGDSSTTGGDDFPVANNDGNHPLNGDYDPNLDQTSVASNEWHQGVTQQYAPVTTCRNPMDGTDGWMYKVGDTIEGPSKTCIVSGVTNNKVNNLYLCSVGGCQDKDSQDSSDQADTTNSPDSCSDQGYIPGCNYCSSSIGGINQDKTYYNLHTVLEIPNEMGYCWSAAEHNVDISRCDGHFSIVDCSTSNSSRFASSTQKVLGKVQAASDSLTAEESGNYAVYAGDDFEQPIAEFAVNLDGADRAEIRLFVDANGNGVKDEGETVLDDYTQIQLKKESEVATYNLFAGWNLVTVPLISDEGVDTASKLLEHFNDQGAEVKHVAKYTSSGFEMYTKRENDQEYSNDFNIVPGQGYFLLNYSAAKVKISGHKFDQSVPFRVRNGWNLVGVYTNEREYTAEDLLKEMSSEGIQADTLSKYDGGQYTSVIYEDDVVYGNDYNIFERAGYFLRVVSGGGEDVKFTPID